MPDIDLLPNRIVVLASALAYWVGVLIQARRVRHLIGHSPNLKPRGAREKLLWLGWTLVVVSWLALPFLARTDATFFLLKVTPAGLPGLLAGTALVLAGYLGTLWCYAAMGDTWRIGVNRKEKTALVRQGPYRLLRHPIYAFQIYMLAGVALLLPAPFSALVLAFHFACALVKATDEENYLRTVHRQDYEDYLSRTGRFFPKLRLQKKP